MRFLRSYGVAFLLIVIVAVWMGSGILVRGGQGPGKGETAVISLIGGDPSIGEHAGEGDEVDPHLSIAERNAENVSEEGPARSVRIKTFLVQAMPLEVPLRGKTKAKSIISAAAETAGIVDKVSVTKGQQVAAGDLLCTLDQGTRAASVAQAKANLASAQLNYDTNTKLRDKGLAAPNTETALESALKSAEAALDQAQAELDRTEIHSKIPGIVQDPMAEEGALLPAGGVCATIVQLDPLIFVGSIPEARIGLAKTGLPATLTTVNGRTASGEVTYIAATADASTRTFDVEMEVPNPDNAIRSGLTATATVDMGTIPAHLLPQSVLTLDDAGALGVRAVKDSKVEFYPITIISDTREGVWVSGLPAQVDVITLGQENVQAGQTVNAQTADDEGATS